MPSSSMSRRVGTMFFAPHSGQRCVGLRVVSPTVTSPAASARSRSFFITLGIDAVVAALSRLLAREARGRQS